LKLLPWDYFFVSFDKFNFPDLFDPLWMGSGILLIVLIVGAIFRFDFIVILVILVSGLFTMAYARFRRFPPLFEAYEHQLARQRYLARARSARPEATIRTKRPTGRRGGKRR